MTTENAPQWVPIARAVVLAGISRGTLMRWIGANEVQSRRDGRGHWEVLLASVVDRVGQSAERSEGDDDDDNDEPAALGSHVIAQAARALGIANRHVEMLLEPARKLLEQYSAENSRLTKRVGELEDKLAANLETYEKAASEEHKRRLEEERQRREHDRLDKTFESLRGIAPAVFAGVAGHFGLAGAQETILVDFVAQLSDEQFRVLGTVLPPGHFAVVERVRATRRAAQQNGTGATAGASAGARS